MNLASASLRGQTISPAMPTELPAGSWNAWQQSEWGSDAASGCAFVRPPATICSAPFIRRMKPCMRRSGEARTDSSFGERERGGMAPHGNHPGVITCADGHRADNQGDGAGVTDLGDGDVKRPLGEALTQRGIQQDGFCLPAAGPELATCRRACGSSPLPPHCDQGVTARLGEENDGGQNGRNP